MLDSVVILLVLTCKK